MSQSHEHGRRKGGRVAEPVQVYLAPGDRARLERLADQLDATKSDILRRGLEALEQQLTDVENHPALKIIGIADRDVGPPLGDDPAREHDRVLAEAAIASWSPPKRSRRAR